MYRSITEPFTPDSNTVACIQITNTPSFVYLKPDVHSRFQHEAIVKCRDFQRRPLLIQAQMRVVLPQIIKCPGLPPPAARH